MGVVVFVEAGFHGESVSSIFGPSPYFLMTGTEAQPERKPRQGKEFLRLRFDTSEVPVLFGVRAWVTTYPICNMPGKRRGVECARLNISSRFVRGSVAARGYVPNSHASLELELYNWGP